jgi:hypothetical protein
MVQFSRLVKIKLFYKRLRSLLRAIIPVQAILDLTFAKDF